LFAGPGGSRSVVRLVLPPTRTLALVEFGEPQDARWVPLQTVWHVVVLLELGCRWCGWCCLQRARWLWWSLVNSRTQGAWCP
jgi:hypothetical protein